MADPEFALIVFGILLGIIILACAVIRICAWCDEPVPVQETRVDREGHNRGNRNDRNRNNRNRNNTNNGNRNNGLQSKLRSQSYNYVSPYVQNFFEQQSQSGSFRTEPSQSEPTEPGPSQAGPSEPGPSQAGPSQPRSAQLGPIPSAPPLSILLDHTRSPRDITNRNLDNKSPNPPPPSYRDLFPSDSSSS